MWNTVKNDICWCIYQWRAWTQLGHSFSLLSRKRQTSAGCIAQGRWSLASPSGTYRDTYLATAELIGTDNRTFRQTINLLLPSDVTGMLNEVKLPGQLGEHMQQICQLIDKSDKQRDMLITTKMFAPWTSRGIHNNSSKSKGKIAIKREEREREATQWDALFKERNTPQDWLSPDTT